MVKTNGRGISCFKAWMGKRGVPDVSCRVFAEESFAAGQALLCSGILQKTSHDCFRTLQNGMPVSDQQGIEIQFF